MPTTPLTKTPNGPIPGENYTSNTKNYPWHRPPDNTNLDDAILASMKQLTTRKATYHLLNTLQVGMPIVQAATLFVISGIGAGKWSVDHGILLAGPIAKIMQIMADGAKIKYTLGLEHQPIPTSSFYNDVKKIDQESVTFAQEAAKQKISDVKAPADQTNGSSNPISDTGTPSIPSPVSAKGAPSGPTPPPMGISAAINTSASDKGFVNPDTTMRRSLPPVLPEPLSKYVTTIGGA